MTKNHLLKPNAEGVVPLIIGSVGLHFAPLIIDDDAPSPLRRAAADFCKDIFEATGVQGTLLHEVPKAPVIILIGVVDESRLIRSLVERTGFHTASSEDEWDSFSITAVASPFPGISSALVIVGGNARGAMYGLYRLSEVLLGTDPLKHWTGLRPSLEGDIVWHPHRIIQEVPRIRYRGFFVNDEDALLSWRGEPEDGRVAPEVQMLVIETLCRLGGNMLAPPMWAGYMDEDSLHELDARDLYYTASHLEVLLSNPQKYWSDWCLRNLGRELPYSYTRHRSELLDFWRESIGRHQMRRCLWPVGLRGAADTAFWESDPWAPESMADRARVVSAAIADQQALLREVLGAGGEGITTLTMRDEVLELYQTGYLVVPEETILIWDDLARKSIIRALPDQSAADRNGGNGIYYHLNFCQNPRMQYLPPALIHGELQRAWQSGADRYLLLNVGNLREIVLQAELAMALAWRPKVETVHTSWTDRFLAERFSNRYGNELASLVRVLYDDFVRTEYDYRVSQVAECIGPLVTLRDFYKIWDPISAGDFVANKGDPTALAVFAAAIDFSNLPERCWCFRPERMPAMQSLWDDLYARALELEGQMTGEPRRFFFENMILQIQTSRLFNRWAVEVLRGFREASTRDFVRAAEAFDLGAEALEQLENVRARDSEGPFRNWFLGEYHHVFRKSFWTLKPRWHAEDTRKLAHVARTAATS